MPASRVTSKNPWHLVLLLDDSQSMEGEPSNDLNEALKEMIAELKMLSMGQKPYFKVSVVSFGSGYSNLLEAQSETNIDEDDLANFSGKSGSTNAAAALDEAARILKANPGEETDFEPFVFFLSDGYPDNADLALKSGSEIKGLDLASGRPRIVTLGFGDVDENFMKSLASNAELYKKLSSSADIRKLLPAIGTIGTQVEGAAQVEEAIVRL